MTPTSGPSVLFARTAAAASRIWRWSSLIVFKSVIAPAFAFPARGGEGGREPGFGLPLAHPFPLEHLAPRGTPPRERDLPALDAEQLAHQLHHRLVRPALHGRRRARSEEPTPALQA